MPPKRRKLAEDDHQTFTQPLKGNPLGSWQTKRHGKLHGTVPGTGSLRARGRSAAMGGPRASVPKAPGLQKQDTGRDALKALYMQKKRGRSASVASSGGGAAGQHLPPKRKVQEDDPAWNWRTMGNRKASKGVRRKHPSGSRY